MLEQAAQSNRQRDPAADSSLGFVRWFLLFRRLRRRMLCLGHADIPAALNALREHEGAAANTQQCQYLSRNRRIGGCWLAGDDKKQTHRDYECEHEELETRETGVALLVAD